MNYVRLGNSGLKITELTFGLALTIGTEITDVSQAQALIDKAWELGVRSFDVANSYGNGKAEYLLGQCLNKYPREEYVLLTKGSLPVGSTPYHRGLSRKHIMWAFNESLKRLGKEYVDVYFAHRYDPEVPMEEIVRTFNDLVRSNRALYWGVSEWPYEALDECVAVCDRLGMERPVTEQFIYSFAVQKHVKSGYKDTCTKYGMGTMGFSPLCQGFLTGKYRNDIPSGSRIAKSDDIDYQKTKNFYPQNKERIDGFLNICDKYNADYVAVALQWCLRNGVYPVFGSSKVTQLEQNVKALDMEVPDAIWAELSAIE
ncbi:MAG: aldo/keto reductase [Bacteroidales bacterium]|nr:aldo/keto reductase [Bacteroidales bacterium]MBO7646891.1 aldo/keto reductase [Bacteroidales bacterium]